MSLFRFGKKEPAVPVAPKGTIVVLKIGGMTCVNCQHHVGEALRGVPGVHSADVDLKTNEARVDLDPAKVRTEQLTKAVADVGYEATAA